MIYTCLQMSECQVRCGVSGERLKGHEISMNSREVISILLLLPGPKGLYAQLPVKKGKSPPEICYLDSGPHAQQSL